MSFLEDKVRNDNQIDYEHAPVVVKIRDLNKSFGENHVLDHFDLNLYEGENLVVLGRSGSGKTVLIKCLVGLFTPDTGYIEIFGKNLTDLDQDGLDELRTDIGFLFQGSALYDSMTVRENLAFPLRRHPEKHVKGANITDLVTETLDSVGLAHAIDLMPSELSGGMKKRVALARTLMLRPRIILYDEPTTGLDSITGKEISQLILDIQKQYNTSSLIITHDMVCTRMTANRIITLIDGTNYAEGSYKELEQSTDSRVRAFFK